MHDLSHLTSKAAIAAGEFVRSRSPEAFDTYDAGFHVTVWGGHGCKLGEGKSFDDAWIMAQHNILVWEELFALIWRDLKIGGLVLFNVASFTLAWFLCDHFVTHNPWAFALISITFALAGFALTHEKIWRKG